MALNGGAVLAHAFIVTLAIGSFLVAPADTQVRRRAAYDFTGDGTSDLLFRSGDHLGFWEFRAGSVIGRRYLGQVTDDWDVVGLADYNGDGTSDILFRHQTTGAIGYWAIDNGAMVGFVPLAWATGTDWLVVSSSKRSDLNGDGRDDILWHNRRTGELGYYALKGAGPFEFEWIVLGRFERWYWRVAGTGDFTGDGRADVLWMSAERRIGYFRVEGSAWEWVELQPRVPDGWSVKTIGDFDGDTVDDIYWVYVTNDVIAEALWNIDHGALSRFHLVPFEYSTWSFSWGWLVAAGDYFRDGSEDTISGIVGSPPQVRLEALGIVNFPGGAPIDERELGAIAPWFPLG
jgi:hypothetical protein